MATHSKSSKTTKDTPATEQTKQPLKGQSNKYIGGFVTFVRTQGVIGLAVGLALGGAITLVVKSLIDNIVMPPLGFLLGSGDGLDGLTWSLGTTGAGEEAVIYYGSFLNDVINFLVIALTIYLIVHLLGADRFDKTKA